MPTPAPNSPALQLNQVSKVYGTEQNQVHALQNISLTLPSGSFTAIMGPSGSGKSTFLNCAAGLDTPTSGQVLLGGVDITRLSAGPLTSFRRDKVGFIFQSYNLLPQLTVSQNIELPLLLSSRPTNHQWKQKLVTAVGLEGMENRLPGELSGGQAQRVAIARSLITDPQVVFADEPTGALDSRTGKQILELLRNASQQMGQTVVIVTHDPQVASAAGRVLFLADGRFVDHLDQATPAEISAKMTSLGEW